MHPLARSLLVLSAVPALSLALSTYTLQRSTAEVRAGLLAQLESSGDPEAITPEERETYRAAVGGFDYVDFALEQCGALGFTEKPPGISADFCWYALQPIWARRVGLLMLALALGIAAMTGWARAIARRGPAHELRGMRVGWTALRWYAAAHVLGQAILAVFLAFWATAVFFPIYVPRLIGIVAAIAFGGVAVSFRALARRPTSESRVYGVVLEPAAAPELFSRLRELADEIPTAAPDAVVLGIDDNFFVTEGPLRVTDRLESSGDPAAEGTLLAGRTLFASVSLMQVLEAEESEAVLAHELGHLATGDTQRAAGFTPMLRRCAAYASEVEESFTFGLGALFEWYVDAFRTIHATSSRAAELDADAAAARTVGADHVASALFKITAYSTYRHQQEDELITAMKEHEGLDIQGRVRGGFRALLEDEAFRASVMDDVAPHPYDSHPPLADRLASLGVSLPTLNPEALEGEPLHPLTERIPPADAIASRLWGSYQALFLTAHRDLIALRLRPTTPEEIEALERLYPPRTFVTTDEITVYRVDWRGLSLDDRVVPFDTVLELFDDGRTLTIAIEGEAYPKVDLSTLGPDAREFVETVSRYRYRHRRSLSEAD